MTTAKSSAEITAGVLMFARKRPGFDQQWSAEIRDRVRAALNALGVKTVGAEEPVLDDATVFGTLDRIQDARCDALIVIQPSLADGQYAMAVMQRWSGPVILWATPERPGDGKVSSCSLVGQNLWSSILRQANRPFEFVYAAPEDAESALNDALAISRAFQRLRRAKLGRVGTHVPGFIDLAADPYLIHKTFGLQLHPLSLPIFMDRVRSIEKEAVDADLAKVAELKLLSSEEKKVVTNEALELNSRFYLAMRSFMEEYSLDALSLQCWPELPAMLGQWPYFAVSRLSAEGEAISIEGDVDGAIGSLIGKFAGTGPGFLTDWLEHDDETIFFWHPGMAPLDMCEDGPTIGPHFNSNQPFVVDAPIRMDEPITVTRLWQCDGKYHGMAFEGSAITPRRHTSGNTLLLEVDGAGVRDRFDRLIHAGLPHHVTLHFGRQAKKWKKLGRMHGVEWHD